MFEKYLITGATGFLGRTVLAQLKDAKAEVRALGMDAGASSECSRRDGRRVRRGRARTLLYGRG